MNAGPTAGRVYEALRSLILNHGFCPGDRLDAALLAERCRQRNAGVRVR
jgi:DNA-binding GntR family transcriptional regulator